MINNKTFCILGVVALLGLTGSIHAQFEVDVPDEDTPFETAVMCYGVYSKYYQMQLIYVSNQAEVTPDMGLGLQLARLGLRTWEKAILDRLPDQAADVQQNYPNTIQQASQALTSVFQEGGWDYVRETKDEECDSYISGDREAGLNPLDAGVTIPLKDSARSMNPDQMTLCLAVAEWDRVMMGPPGVIKGNAFRQRYADWMAEGGFSAEEVSARTEEDGRNAFEELFTSSVFADMNGAEEIPYNEATAFCMPLLDQ